MPKFTARNVIFAPPGRHHAGTPGLYLYVSPDAQVRRWWRAIKKARQRLVLCRLMIDLMRGVHGAYAPASEPFGTRLETFFIGLCVALGDIDGKPFSVAKIAAYMRVPRTTVIRRLDRLRRWG